MVTFADDKNITMHLQCYGKCDCVKSGKNIRIQVWNPPGGHFSTTVNRDFNINIPKAYEGVKLMESEESEDIDSTWVIAAGGGTLNYRCL